MKIKKVLLSAVATLCLTAGVWAQTVIPAYVPTNSLVGWWPFNGNANDLSVNANNGTVNGATLTADRFGNPNKAYSFNGVSNNILISNLNNLTYNPISYNFWFKPNALCNVTSNDCWKMIIGRDQFGNLNQGVFSTLNHQNNNLNNIFLYYTGGDDSRPNLTPLTNNWYNLGFTYASDNIINWYLNGNLIKKDTLINNSNAQIPFYIGSGGNRFYWNGLIDDIGIWNRVLSGCEVKKLYYAPSFSASASNPTICAGQSLTLTAGGVPNYAWSNGANTASTVVTPSTSIIYTVTSTYTTGCTDTKTVSVSVSPCTAIKEFSATPEISVFPNPAKESVSINAHSALIGKVYSISDHLGKHIATGVLSAEKTTISLHGLAKGFYFLNVGGKNYKIIKE